MQVNETKAEEALANACVDGMVWLRMDRVQQTVSFQQPQAAETVLSNWTGNYDNWIIINRRSKRCYGRIRSYCLFDRKGEDDERSEIDLFVH